MGTEMDKDTIINILITILSALCGGGALISIGKLVINWKTTNITKIDGTESEKATARQLCASGDYDNAIATYEKLLNQELQNQLLLLPPLQ